MHVILVGSEPERARLRARLADDVVVIAEAATLAEARALDRDADAWIVAPPRQQRLGIGLEPGPERLTAREQEVLELLALGLPNKAIAARLGISDQTAKLHVAAICGKLGAANRTEAVRVAFSRGLVTL